MNNPDIEKLITGLRQETAKIANAEERELAMMRLQDVAAKYSGDDQIVSTEFILEEMKQRPPEERMYSGFASIDELLGGFRPKQLIVFSGITKHGKTSFCVELTTRMKQYNPMWIPLEESAEEILQKFLDEERPPPVFYTPHHTVTVITLDWVERKIIEAKVKFGTKVVFIDHLGFLVPRTENQSQETGHVVRAIKTLAKKWDVAVVLLCHLTKTELNKQPNLENLYGSVSISQEADTVMFIWRETTKDRRGMVEMTNNVSVSVQANRRTGKTGNIKMKLMDNRRYMEVDWKYAKTSEELADEEFKNT